MDNQTKLDVPLNKSYEMKEFPVESSNFTKFQDNHETDHSKSIGSPTIKEFDTQEATLFDNILNRIGFGKYHYKVFFILGLLGMADGSESIVISFVIPIFMKEFQPTFDFESDLGTCIYIGYFIGSLLSGYFSDKYGRKRPVIYSNLLMIILGLISAFPPGLVSFIFLRGLFGIIVGFFSPLSYSILAEITPLKYRGKYMVLLGIFYTIGEVISCLIAIFTLENLDSGNWHALLAWSTLPAFFAWIASTFYLDESARHEMMIGNFSNGIRILNKMYKENHGREGPVMTPEEEKELMRTHTILLKQKKKQEEKVLVKELFKGINKKITPSIWFNWFANCLTFFGLIYLLPTTLSLLNKDDQSKENKFDVSSVIYSCLSELPSVFVVAAIIDVKYLGRKNSLFLTFLIGGITCFFAYFQMAPGFVFWISITKFFFNITFTLNYQFTSEIYPTRIRGTGIGMASAFGRIGSFLMPNLVTWLQSFGTLVPYLLYAIGSAIAGFGTLLLPYDTTQIEMGVLDQL